ncbi:hypothetical protein BTVI_25058 [Pitangus sulphuratus]|nr:hypothetical protein BTVI_25058 [Pitangus sulphuratus]
MSTQIVVVNSVMSKWRPVMSVVPQGLVLGLAPFNISVDDIDREIECTPRNFAGDPKLSGVVDILVGQDAIDASFLREDLVRDWLSRLNTHRSLGSHVLDPQMLRDLAGVAAKLLSIIFEKSGRTGEMPSDWRKASVTAIFTKGEKEDLTSSASLTSIPGKVMEQIILEVITEHIEENKVIRSGQHGFTKGKSGLTKLIAFCDVMADGSMWGQQWMLSTLTSARLLHCLS